jgi:hypothetical protein
VTLGRPAFGFDDDRFRRRVGRLLIAVAVAQLLAFVARGAIKPSDPTVTPLPSAATTSTAVAVTPSR